MNNKETKYTHQDPFIAESLNDYKDLIDLQKEDILSISNYRVEKPWGHEIWLELNEFYVYKLIHMKAGNQSSLQLHKYKYETNYVISGIATVLLEDETGSLNSKVFNVGDGWSVPLNRKHRVIATTDYTALEVSTSHLNDVIRFEDDNNRTSGKIDSEHKK
jgi:mannose-6-phosphate isomerase-like protein (cupin superfamily)